MNQKVGIAESGMARTEMIVARQSRRKKKTTMTARCALDHRRHRALVLVLGIIDRGEHAAEFVDAREFRFSSYLELAPPRHRRRVTSEGRGARVNEKVATGLPSKLAIEVTSP